MTTEKILALFDEKELGEVPSYESASG